MESAIPPVESDQPAHEIGTYHFPPFSYEFGTQRLIGLHGEIRLPLKSAAVLGCLIRHRGHIVSKEEILAEVWQGTSVSDDAIVQRVLDIRKALDRIPGGQGLIRTHPKRGYEFLAPKELQPSPIPDVPFVSSTSFRRVSLWLTAVSVMAAVLCVGIWIMQRRQTSSWEAHHLKVSQLTFREGRNDFPAFDASGNRLLYVSDEAGVPNVWLLDRKTEKRKQITRSSGALSELDWCSDGEWIAYRSQGEKSGIYVLSLISGQSIFVSSQGHHPRWSPDGKSLVFHGVGESASLFQWNRETETIGRIDIPDGRLLNLSWPVWGNDNNTIYFVARVAGASAATQHGSESLVSLGHQIWMFKLRERSLMLASPGVGVLRDGGLDFDRKRAELIFVGVDCGLWSFPVSRSSGIRQGEPIRLTVTTQAHQHPRVGPNGDIAFSATLGGEALWNVPIQKNGELNQEHMTRLTGETASLRSPSLSPDGKHIAYFIWQGSHFELWLLDLSTHTSHEIGPDDGLSRTSPVWSADGSTLKYTVLGKQLREERTARLNEDFSRLVNETKLGNGFVGKSPFPSDLHYALSLGNQDGQRVVEVISKQGRKTAVTPPGHYFHPLFSEHGRHIYFQSDASGWIDIWAVNFDPTSGKAISPPRQMSHFGGSPYLLSDNNLVFLLLKDNLVVPLRTDQTTLWVADGR